ncbi:MAG TPA: glycosyltransferase [Solirubrobacteraceae bacterium]|jgi:glycosyltransferase involved in cell wall biosynthesis|nr:glycosyltransferase [Solirubrobacteraceae bacterium]
MGAPLENALQVTVVGSRDAVPQLLHDAGEIPGVEIVGMALESERSAALNAAIHASAPSDIVAVLPGVSVGAGWLQRLRAAALSDSTVASATPLSLGYGGIEIFERERAVEPSPDRTARSFAGRSLQLRPKIATMGPGCFYVRRAAVDLVAPLDESLPLEQALADLAARLSATGMVHVLADDVLVVGDAQRRAAQGGGLPPEALQETLIGDERSSLHRAMSRARATLRGLSVTIDGRALTAATGGTQTYIIELILALARDPGVTVRVLVPPDLSERAREALASVSDVERLTYEQAIDRPPMTDVVHRPQQVFTTDDLALLRLVGERVVVGQQDLIAYHNHSYHRDLDTWRAYRRTTRLALAGADQVIFFSEHARHDALAEDLMPGVRAHVVGVGAEALEVSAPASDPPGGLGADDEFLLCLGADYAHKNRPFAIELLGALRELGWGGRLVLAGAHVPFGSSRAREGQLLEQRPELAPFVLDLGVVDEPARRWLYAHARALVYATVYEGYGLLPLEAARARLPCLFAAQASLSEVAGAAATLIPWDAAASARAVRGLVEDGPARDAHLAQLRALPIPSWSEVASQLVAVYERAVSDPGTEAAPRIWQELDRERYLATLHGNVIGLKQTAQEYQDAYHSLEARVEDGLPLIDEGGLLSPDQQRGLMRVAGRRVGAAALKPLGVLGRFGQNRSRSSHDS